VSSVRARPTLARITDLGATAQATVPGFYAWLVTVAPVAFGRGAPVLSRLAAIVGLALLFQAPFVERRWKAAARVMSIWGLVATSLLVWVLAPAGYGGGTSPALLSPGKGVAWTRSDPVRTIAGVIGWALFALASISPALPRREVALDELSRRLQPRGDSGWVDAFVLGFAIVLAVLLQGVGWQAEEAERAVLVRLVSLGAGVMIVGASASIVVARHGVRRPLTPNRRVKRAVLPLVILGLWAAGGVIHALVGR
jgi:hypothetical protein